MPDGRPKGRRLCIHLPKESCQRGRRCLNNGRAAPGLCSSAKKLSGRVETSRGLQIPRPALSSGAAGLTAPEPGMLTRGPSGRGCREGCDPPLPRVAFRGLVSRRGIRGYSPHSLSRSLRASGRLAPCRTTKSVVMRPRVDALRARSKGIKGDFTEKRARVEQGHGGEGTPTILS